MEVLNTLNRFREFIMFKYNSANTADAYCSAVGVFLNHFKERAEPKDINADEIIAYLMTIHNLHTRRNAHSAVKLFYKHKSKNGFSNKFRYIPYPEKPHTLPNPISKEEFILIINACDNIKHKCIMMLPFDSGLRVSEVINLKLEHIDTFKMQIHVKGAKGRKDRIVKLSQILFNYLCEYVEKYTPIDYLFNGQFPAKELRYSVRSCQEVLKIYAKKAGIRRNIKFHEARHGFAVSLLDNDTPLDTIRERLGHASIETTRIYAPLSNREIQRTESPMEQIIRTDETALINTKLFKNNSSINFHILK